MIIIEMTDDEKEDLYEHLKIAHAHIDTVMTLLNPEHKHKHEEVELKKD